jgi:sulfur relay (sulfurtransferase) DsrC/TusE family protein
MLSGDFDAMVFHRPGPGKQACKIAGLPKPTGCV